jgi:hypothetical protein
MVSLLVVSLVLSTTASIPTQVPAAPADPLLVASQPFVLIQPNGPVQPFDNMEIHPDPEVCYKIRAYWFTKGQNPRFLRETTCGPTRTNAKQMREAKPGLMPLDLKAKPDRTPQ